MVKIAHASIDENGKTVGGLAGDRQGEKSASVSGIPSLGIALSVSKILR